jgi:Protein of unknown function (DUF2920)
LFIFSNDWLSRLPRQRDPPTQDIETGLVDRFRSKASLATRRIERSHPDIELGVVRSPLDYLVCVPDAGLTPETGLILFRAGYGMEPRGDYVCKLLYHLANEHDCVAASVDYFGADLWSPGRCKLVPHPGFFAALKRHYGLEVNAPKGFDTRLLVQEIVAALAQRGVKALHGDCLLMGIISEYYSMGILPALDGLQVTHRLIGEFALNRRRLFLLGTSYGGYIVNLMAKFAPKTFRMVIDNSGFSSAEDDIWNVYGMTKWHFANGFTVNTRMIASFSQNAKDANFFSPSRRNIRSLLDPNQAFAGTARLYGYHPINDDIAPIEKKLGLRDIHAGRTPYDLVVVDEGQIDGRVFKDLSHGMRASMRGLFALSHDKFRRDGGALAFDTDFDRQSRYLFVCGDEDYLIRLTHQGVSAEQTRSASA